MSTEAIQRAMESDISTLPFLLSFSPKQTSPLADCNNQDATALDRHAQLENPRAQPPESTRAQHLFIKRVLFIAI